MLFRSDLKEGMMVTGKVKNVVDFGAFVDIGIKESALIHVSEMSDRFIEDPMDVLKVGDVKQFRIISLDVVRKRIGLSLKSERRESPHSGTQSAAHIGAQSGISIGTQKDQREPLGGTRRVVTVRKSGDSPAGQAGRGAPSNSGSGSSSGYRSDRPGRPASTTEDEGTSYNPFADLLKNMKK